MDAAGGSRRPGVTEVRTAASLGAIPTIRAVAVDLAARAGFDRDAIADLQVALEDAGARLIRLAAAGSTLRCSFVPVRLERIEVIAEVDVDKVVDPVPRGSFGWWVLWCLTDDVAAVIVPGDAGRGARVCLMLIKRALTVGPW